MPRTPPAELNGSRPYHASAAFEDGAAALFSNQTGYASVSRRTDFGRSSFAPLIRFAFRRVPYTFNGRVMSGIKFASAFDGLPLGRQHVTGPLGAATAHRVIALIPALDIKLILVLAH
jgi:hypothetical protein